MAVSTFGAVAIAVLKDPIDGTRPGWTAQRHVVTLDVPHSTDHVTQLLGGRRKRLAARLAFADQAAYDALDAVVQTVATLTIAGASQGSCALLDLGSETRFSDGSIEADATFERTA